MKVKYKGYEIEVKREQCMAGYSMLYYSIMHDDFECLSNFEDSAETVASIVKNLKGRIDSELEEDNPWGEKEEQLFGLGDE